MKVKVTQSTLQGSIKANVSKSYAQRAYALATLSSSPTRITRTSWSDDAIAALQIAQNLGASVSHKDDVVTIIPNALQVSDYWNVGESGLSLRMYSAIAAGLDRRIIMDGHGSIKHRPTEFIKGVLSTMGAIVTGDGLPLTIEGPLKPGQYHVDGSFSSQLLTGLLIALPLLKGDTELIVHNLTSTPYIDMTMEMMRVFGVEVSHEDYNVFKIAGGQKYIGTDVEIEADWSGLAFILVAAAISMTKGESGGVTVTGVHIESSQADRVIIDILHMVGCKLDFNNAPKDDVDAAIDERRITIKSAALSAFSFDATNCPDLIPPLSILATQCVGTSRIAGMHRLQHKESDRGLVLSTELGKLGARIDIEDDVMLIDGRQELHGAVVDANGDHRIAMTLACAGMVAKGETIIHGAECVSKSYRNFYADIRALNGSVDGEKSLFVIPDPISH